MAKIQMLYCPHTKRETFKEKKNQCSQCFTKSKDDYGTKNTHQICETENLNKG